MDKENVVSKSQLGENRLGSVGWQAIGMAHEEEDPTFEEENKEIGRGAEGG
jgi:hypothetical protein